MLAELDREEMLGGVERSWPAGEEWGLDRPDSVDREPGDFEADGVAAPATAEAGRKPGALVNAVVGGIARLLTATGSFYGGLVRAKRANTRESLEAAGLFALQVGIASALLMLGYAVMRAPGVAWAVISAGLVVQAGPKQSVTASAVRTAANVVGASTAMLVGHFIGAGPVAVLATIAAVAFVCEVLRLDLSLRSACVPIPLVLLGEGSAHLEATAMTRMSAIIIGCVVALGVVGIVSTLRWSVEQMNATAGPVSLDDE